MNNIPAIADTFGASKQEFNHHPKNDTVISLDQLGKPLSYFESEIWELGCYAHNYTDQSEINFYLDHTSPKKYTLSHQIKIVLFYLMFSRKRRDNNITLKTIQGNFFIIRKIAYLCLDFNCDFTNIKNNGIFLKSLKNHLSELSWE
ncbi:hypothetical protein, partial [Acinetobacter lactucae]|uniref:hypothetical protein n=1 Tax=Acinetobacter lactucae TaxID=1785128 RepID=UPI0015811344